MAVALLPRSAWTSHGPIRPLTPLDPAQVRGLAVHWPGSTGAWGQTPTLAETIKRLETQRRQHTTPSLADPSKPWSDFGYCLAADLAGRLFEGRGLGYRPASNGSSVTNAAYPSITVLMGPRDKVTPAAVDAVRYARELLLERYPHATQIVGHRDLHPTECPGPELYELLQSGAFTAPVQEDDDMPTADEIADAIFSRLASAAQDTANPPRDPLATGALNAVSAEVLGPRASYLVRVSDPRRAEVTLPNGAPVVSPVGAWRQILDETITARSEIALIRAELARPTAGAVDVDQLAAALLRALGIQRTT